MEEEKDNAIAHAIAEHFLRENFRLTSGGEYRRRLGQTAETTGIPADELHQFILGKLPKIIGNMFGWDQCGITGSIWTAE